jgi:hypothetical protein
MTLKIHTGLTGFIRPSPHSTFSPSGADRWLACAYSVNASKGIPEEDSIYSIEGTIAHSFCEAVFYKDHLGTEIPVDLYMKTLEYDQDEMMECAVGYSEVIRYWLSNKEIIGDVLYYGLEKGIPVFPEEGCFGTADCLIIGTKSSVVIDYKHGKGKNVGAGSLQLKVYAAGVARYLIDVPEGYRIFAVVYQPRTDSAPKETSYDMPALNAFLGDIHKAIQASKAKDLAPVEGNHCYWCPAKRTKDTALMCPIMKEKPVKLANERFDKFLADMNAPINNWSEPNPKRDEAMIKIMSLLPMMKDIAESAEEEFKLRLLKGEAIPGMRLIDKFGKRMINAENDEDTVTLLKSKFPNLNPLKVVPATTKLRTITDIEKEIGKNKLDSICIKKVTKEVDILDEKIRSILGEMAAYGQIINSGPGQKE